MINTAYISAFYILACGITLEIGVGWPWIAGSVVALIFGSFLLGESNHTVTRQGETKRVSRLESLKKR